MSKLINEYLKLKQSKLVYFIVASVLLSPIALMLLVVILNSDPKYNSVTYLEYMSLVLKFIVSIVGLTMYNWIAAEIVAREFRMDTVKSQLTIPISRSSFLFSKLTLISILLVLMTVWSFLISVIISIGFDFKGLTYAITIKLLIVYIKSAVLMLPFAYFTVLMVIFFRQTLAPMVINLFILIISSVARITDLFAIFPWTAPYRIIFISADHIDTSYTLGHSYIAILLLGIVSMYFANNKINTMEI